MDFLTFLSEHYHWQLSLYAALGIMAVTFVGKRLLLLVPEFRDIQRLNKEAAERQQGKSYWPPVRRRSHLWGGLTQLAIFVFILPFCLTLDAQPWWKYPLDIFVILMVYDFFYHLTHRFLFHNSGNFKGPLLWVHAIHHQQKNPCRADSSYLHPLEAAMGLLLYAGCILGLSLIMGPFHLVTIIITWVAFSEINLHNHDLQEIDRFPFRYLKYASDMHHIHHARFTAGNFATISLFYDCLFGTLDKGEGYEKEAKANAAGRSA